MGTVAKFTNSLYYSCLMIRPIKIASSILVADFARLAEAGGVDYIHVDVMDGYFVPHIAVGLAVHHCLISRRALDGRRHCPLRACLCRDRRQRFHRSRRGRAPRAPRFSTDLRDGCASGHFPEHDHAAIGQRRNSRWCGPGAGGRSIRAWADGFCRACAAQDRAGAASGRRRRSGWWRRSVRSARRAVGGSTQKTRFFGKTWFLRRLVGTDLFLWGLALFVQRPQATGAEIHPAHLAF